MEYKDLKIEHYNELLSAKKSTPGGGSALAITLSLACSLCNMVINFTIEKKGYEHLKEKLIEYQKKINLYLKNAYQYADLDSKTFSDLMAAYKSQDQDEIARCSKEASLVPFNLYLLTERVQTIADDLFLIGNKNVVSDAKIASDLCYSIYPGCILNIKANIKNISDQETLNLLKTILE